MFFSNEHGLSLVLVPSQMKHLENNIVESETESFTQSKKYFCFVAETVSVS